MTNINLQNGFVLGKILAADVTAEQLPEYKNLTYNADNSITLTDLDDVTHTLTPTYDETTGKLISYVFDDKTLFVNYDTDGNLSKVFGIDIEGTENYVGDDTIKTLDNVPLEKDTNIIIVNGVYYLWKEDVS